MKHLARATRQQTQSPDGKLSRLIISTQNSDVPHQHCGATLASCVCVCSSAEEDVCHARYKDVKCVITVVARPQRSAWRPDAESLVCASPLEAFGSGGGWCFVFLPSVLIRADADARCTAEVFVNTVLDPARKKKLLIQTGSFIQDERR